MTPPPRILYVIGSLDLGGAERHIALVAPRLRRKGWEPLIYCISHRGTQVAEVTSAGATVFGPPFEHGRGQTILGKGARLFVSSLRLLWLMVTLRPKVIHFFLPLAYLMGAPLALLARAPVLVMSRRRLNNYQKQHPLLRQLELWLHPWMDAILGNSKAVVEQLIDTEYCRRDQVRLIYNGIDIEKVDRASTRSGSVGGQDHLAMIIVANLIPYKGHRDLIKALGTIHGKLPPEWRLTCIGRDQGIRADLENIARQMGILNHIDFLGERTDVESLLKQSDIGLLTSHEEGFSNAILEGMAAGLAMIVTDVGGNAEAVLNGVTGFVVPARDPVALGKAVLALAKDETLRSEMGYAARQRVEEFFSLEACVDQYDRLYRKLSAASETER